MTVGRLDDVIVAYGATGLYDGLYASFGQRLYSVGEREESVTRCGGSLSLFAGLLHGYIR